MCNVQKWKRRKANQKEIGVSDKAFSMSPALYGIPFLFGLPWCLHSFRTENEKSHRASCVLSCFWWPVAFLAFTCTDKNLLPPAGKPLSSVQFSRSVVSNSLQPHHPQHSRPPCPSPTLGVYPNSCPWRRWYHPTILSSVVHFSCLQSFPESGSFPMSQISTSGGQSIEVSFSVSVLPVNIQNWFPLGWTGWISLQSRGFSRVFSNTAVQKHQFFGTQLSL